MTSFFTPVSCATVLAGGWDSRENRGTGEKPSPGALGTCKAGSIWRGRVKEASPRTWAYLKLPEGPNDNWSLSDFSCLSEMMEFCFLSAHCSIWGKKGGSGTICPADTQPRQTSTPQREPAAMSPGSCRRRTLRSRTSWLRTTKLLGQTRSRFVSPPVSELRSVSQLRDVAGSSLAGYDIRRKT